MKSTRPVNLDLLTIKFPPMAIVSILHRISGLLIFLLLPLVLYALGQSLISASHFAEITTQMQSGLGWLLTWGFLTAVLYHLIAGIRHLAMDMGWGDRLPAGRISAWLVMVLALLSSVAMGIWLW